MQVDEETILLCGGFREGKDEDESVDEMYQLNMRTNTLELRENLLLPDFFYCNQFSLDRLRERICAIGKSHVHYLSLESIRATRVIEHYGDCPP